MLIVLFLAITLIWIGACLYRRRYNRNREREIEMRAPVAWGPHQTQSGPSGPGYSNGPYEAGGKGKGKANVNVTTRDFAEMGEHRIGKPKKKWVVKERT